MTDLPQTDLTRLTALLGDMIPLTHATNHCSCFYCTRVRAARALVATLGVELEAVREACNENAHAVKFYEQRLTEIERERDAALKELREHRCQLPSSITDALNSGDGTYRP